MRLNKNFLLLLLLGLLVSSNIVKGDEDAGEDAETEEMELDEEEEAGTAVEKEGGVAVLTDDNFDDYLKEHDVTIVEFYAPWCGHCKSFAPTYEEVATELEGKAGVGKVDATVHKKLGTRFSVSGYPTIKIFKNGEPFEYKGSRSKTDVVNKVLEYADPDWKPPPVAVVTLTKANFDSIVDDADIILVEFYAPWCGHCKKLAPEYEAAAQELKLHDPKIILAKVDATEEPTLATKYDVSGYPTMKMFRKGRMYEYEGGREQNTIVSYMKEQVKPPSKEVTSVKAIRSILRTSADVTIIACFDGEDDKTLEVFQDAGNKLRSEFEFQHTFSSEVMKNLGASVGDVLLFHPERFHSKYEKKRYKFTMTESTDKDALTAFFREHAIPLVGQRTKDNTKTRYNKKSPLVVVYYGVDFSFDYRKATQMVRSKVLDVAQGNLDMTFAIANEDDFGPELKRVGLEDSPEDINVVIYDEDEKRYPMEPSEEFDSDVLSEFVSEFKAGNVKPKIKSAPKPKKNKGSVKIVVGDTFDKIVMDKSSNVLVEFYAPWCGHCKKLEPVFKKVGKKFKDDKRVVIAKMDATANDVPNSAFKVEGFPTIYFKPAGTNTPVKYDGGRTLDDFVEYINKEVNTSGKDEL